MSKAFTLIETIMYLGLFTILIGGAVTTSYQFKASLDTNVTQAMVSEEGSFAMHKIGRMIALTSTFKTPSPDRSSPMLSVVLFNGTKATIDLRNGILTETDDSNVFPLHGNDVTVTSLLFEYTKTDADLPSSITVTYIMTMRTRMGKTIINPMKKIFFLEPS